MQKFSLVFFTFFVFDVLACTCETATPSDYIQQAENILYGRVIGINILQDDNGKEYQKVTFQNIEVLKGNPNQEAFAYFHNFQDGTCDGVDFKLKTHYVSFTDNNGWITGFCGGTEPIYQNIEFSKNYLKDIVKSLPNKQINQDK